MEFLKRNKRTIACYAILSCVIALAIVGVATGHHTLLMSAAAAPVILDKFSGAQKDLPAAEDGTVWVNKPGALNEFNLMALDYFNHMPVQDFAQFYGLGRRLVGAVQHKRWHERIWPAASTIAVTQDGYNFFDKKPGDADTYLDGTAAPAVDDYATNMSDSGRMGKDENLLVYALGIRVDIPHREFAAFTNNRPVSAAVTSTDTSSGTAHQLLLDGGAIFSLRKGAGTTAREVVSGSLFDFPSAGGPGGIASGNTVEGVMTNGQGILNYFDEVVLLDGGRQFNLKMKTYIAMLSVLRVPVRPILYGALIAPQAQ